MTIYCSMSCKIEMEMNELCGHPPPSEPIKAKCFPSECGKAPAWRIKKIVRIHNAIYQVYNCCVGWWIACAHTRTSMGGNDQEKRGHTGVHVWRHCHLLALSRHSGTLFFASILLSRTTRYSFKQV